MWLVSGTDHTPRAETQKGKQGWQFCSDRLPVDNKREKECQLCCDYKKYKPFQEHTMVGLALCERRGSIFSRFVAPFQVFPY